MAFDPTLGLSDTKLVSSDALAQGAGRYTRAAQ